MPVLKPSHLVYLVLIVGGVAIYMHKAEREELELDTIDAAAAACDAREDAVECHQRLEEDHEDCFVVNYKYGRGATKYQHEPNTINTRAYIACITAGYEEWRKTNKRRSL